MVIDPKAELAWITSPHRRALGQKTWIVDPWKWNDVHIPGLYGPAVPGWTETKPYLMESESAMDTENIDVRRKWPIAIEPPHIDRRIAAQEGRFFLFGTAKDLISSPNVMRTGIRGRKARLDKVVISAGKTASIRDELDRISINERNLFPDLGGLSRHIQWEWTKF